MDRDEKTTCRALAGLLAAILLIANAVGTAAQGHLQEAKAKPDQAQTKAAVDGMDYERVTFAGELKRMRSTAHLYQPQGHKTHQYSGFSRKGGNPALVQRNSVARIRGICWEKAGGSRVNQAWTMVGGGSAERSLRSEVKGRRKTAPLAGHEAQK
jgi:hypothetical protein